MIARAGIAWSSLGLMCVSEGMCHGPHGRGVGKLLGLDRGLLSGAGMVLSKGRGRAALQGRELLLLLLEQQLLLLHHLLLLVHLLFDPDAETLSLHRFLMLKSLHLLNVGRVLWMDRLGPRLRGAEGSRQYQTAQDRNATSQGCANHTWFLSRGAENAVSRSAQRTSRAPRVRSISQSAMSTPATTFEKDFEDRGTFGSNPRPHVSQLACQ